VIKLNNPILNFDSPCDMKKKMNLSVINYGTSSISRCINHDSLISLNSFLYISNLIHGIKGNPEVIELAFHA